ncbi:MAG: hypothetical protein ACLRFF_02350, partial [Alphaproteobacteria bacterium]
NLLLSLLSTLFVVFPMLAVANTVELHWYDNDTELRVPTTSQSCEYGGTFDVPTPTPREGYVFTGWRVKIAQCSLSGLDPLINTSFDATHVRWKPIDPTNGYPMAAEFGTENSSDLNNGEWAVTFSYGTVKGMAKCSSTKGSSKKPGTPSDTDGQYCWCQATNYTPNEGNRCNVASPSWVFYSDLWDASNCAGICAFYCANIVEVDAVFRRGVFGVSN